MSREPIPDLPRWDGPLSHPFYSKVIKRALDFLLALILLIPGCVLMLPLALWVRLDSPGPVFYRALRGGYHNRPFYILKFRSMVVDADKTGGTTALNDSRVTRAGRVMRRLKLDELPQLFNILKGDMSLVGPRPERPLFVEKFREEIPRYMVKHQVRPGLTGWAQINGYRGDTSIAGRIECDLYYIENWTLGLDFKIIFLTFFKGFINKNAY